MPMRISPHYLSLMHSADDPLARQVLPDKSELEDQQTEEDPLHEEYQSPVSQVIHRYPHRVIFLVSNQCAVHCCFCMRKRRIAPDRQVPPNALEDGLAYIRKTKEINEVILSGGDPFMLSDSDLLSILGTLRGMDHVRLLRIHTRVPSVWPQRITEDLSRALSALHPLYINIHFNHPDEISSRATEACSLLADAGIPLGSQTVLLRGVNDNVPTLRNLFQRLLEVRVRPYYLHQLDRVPGTAHFQVPLETALGLMGQLRGMLSGQAMPHFMVDLPGGGGKVELLPESCIAKNNQRWVLQNFEGRPFNYAVE